MGSCRWGRGFSDVVSLALMSYDVYKLLIADLTSNWKLP